MVDTLHGGNYACTVYLLFYMICNLLGINDKGKRGRV